MYEFMETLKCTPTYPHIMVGMCHRKDKTGGGGAPELAESV